MFGSCYAKRVLEKILIMKTKIVNIEQRRMIIGGSRDHIMCEHIVCSCPPLTGPDNGLPEHPSAPLSVAPQSQRYRITTGFQAY